MQDFVGGNEWYALRLRARFEKVVANYLQAKNYEKYLPVYRRPLQSTDRTKEVDLPLFPRYIFCKMKPNDQILMIPGVLGIVSTDQSPVSVPEQEILAIQKVVNSGLPFRPCPFLTGHQVRIESGPLRGLEGVVVEVKGSCHLVISVQLLQQSISVEMDRDHLKPIPGSLSQAV